MQNIKPKLLIVMDWQPGPAWVFQRELQKHFDTDVLSSRAPKSFQSRFEKIFGLWKSYAGTALRALRCAGQYDVVYAWHAVIGLMLASLCRLLQIKKPAIVVAQLIVPQKKESVTQRLKTAFTRYALHRVDCVIVYSSIEVEQFVQEFGNGRTRFQFTPLGIDALPPLKVEDNGYIFAGGRSNRDYTTLIKAMKALDYPLHIAAQRFNIPDTQLPVNVHTHFNAFGQDFLDLLAGAALVVIPLDRPDESSGQLVLLQAMALGKAIIITQNRGVADYYHGGESVILVPPHDVALLEKEIARLMREPEERQRLGKNAAKKAAEFTLHAQAKNVADILLAMQQN